MGVPPPATMLLTHMTHMTHTYPMTRFTADCSKSSALPTQEHMAWWKSQNWVAWMVLKTSIIYWCPFHPDLDVPCEHVLFRLLATCWVFITEIDLTNPLLHCLFQDQAASVCGGHLAGTKVFSPFHQKGQAAVNEDIDPEELVHGLACYPFTVRASLKVSVLSSPLVSTTKQVWNRES